MKNDKSQFVVRTSDFYLSLVICHLTEKSFAGRKGFFFAKSSRSWRSSRLRGESWAGLSPRRREAREENAKDFSLVAAMPLCVHLWFRSFFWLRLCRAGISVVKP